MVLQAIPKLGKQVEDSDIFGNSYALSNAQRRLWVLDQMDEHLTAYNMPAAIRLQGDLNVTILEKTFQILFDTVTRF